MNESLPAEYESFPVTAVEDFAKNNDLAMSSLFLLFERKPNGSVDFKDDEQGKFAARHIIGVIRKTGFSAVYDAAAGYRETDQIKTDMMCDYIQDRATFWWGSEDGILDNVRERYGDPQPAN